MGMSTWSYRGQLFDAPDAVLEAVMSLVIRELDELSSVLIRLPKLRHEWRELATEEFGLGVVPDFDDALHDNVRCDTVLRAAEGCSSVAG